MPGSDTPEYDELRGDYYGSVGEKGAVFPTGMSLMETGFG